MARQSPEQGRIVIDAGISGALLQWAVFAEAAAGGAVIPRWVTEARSPRQLDRGRLAWDIGQTWTVGEGKPPVF